MSADILTRSFRSSSSDAVYTANLSRSTGETSCDCPGWKFLKRGATVRSCKHTRELSDEAPSSAAVAAPAAPPATAEPRQAMPSPMLASAITIRSKTEYMQEVAARVAELSNAGHVLEEKFDGVRWVVRKAGADVVAFSRPRDKAEGNQQTIAPALLAELRTLPDGVFDGELVTPGGRSWDVTRLGTEKRLVLFDIIESFGLPTVKEPYSTRREMLALALAHCPGVLVSMPQTQPVSMAAVEAIWARGGEGAIIKRTASTYQAGRRSPDWVKVKNLHHETLTITGFKAGKVASSTPWSVTCLRADDGRETTVSTLNNATVRAISKDPDAWIGKRLVIYYSELTDTRSYRHGGWDHLAAESEGGAPEPTPEPVAAAAAAFDAERAQMQANSAATPEASPSDAQRAKWSAAAHKAAATRAARRAAGGAR